MAFIIIIKPDYVYLISCVMQQEYLAEKFWSIYVVSLMLAPTHENVPGNVFKWQKKAVGPIWAKNEWNNICLLV